MTQTDSEQDSQPREPRPAPAGGVSINIGGNISGSQVSVGDVAGGNMVKGSGGTGPAAGQDEPALYADEAERGRAVRLRKVLLDRLSESDLRDVCFDLGIEYDDLPGETRAAKVRELLTYALRRDALAELIQVGRDVRGDIAWDDLIG